MEVGTEFRVRIAGWEKLSRWERSELGKDLRRLGLSYGEIMDLVPVKKSTLATWCRELKLTEEQVEAIKERTYGSRLGIPVDTQWKRRLEVEQIRNQARTRAMDLMDDPFWVAGTILYWAEGTKGPHQVGLANTDARAHLLFIDWIRRYLVEDAEFRLQLHLHQGNDDDLAKEHWRRALGLPGAQFYKTFIKPPGTGQRKNIHVYGVCTVRLMRSTNAWHTIDAWIQELAQMFSGGTPRSDG
jgi:hypothetical protein